jgi:hypothetical protein
VNLRKFHLGFNCEELISFSENRGFWLK